MRLEMTLIIAVTLIIICKIVHQQTTAECVEFNCLMRWCWSGMNSWHHSMTQFKLLQYSAKNQCFQLISGSLKPLFCSTLDQIGAQHFFEQVVGEGSYQGHEQHGFFVGVVPDIPKTVAVLVHWLVKSCVCGRSSPEGLLNCKRVSRSASPAALSCQTALSSLTANHRRPFWPSHLTRQPSVTLLLCCFLHRCCLSTFHQLNAVHCGQIQRKPRWQDFKI